MKQWLSSEFNLEANNHIPEKKLLAAVLQRAITDYLAGEGDLKVSAEKWLMSDDESDFILSFKFICEALDINMFNLRRALILQSRRTPYLFEEAV
ncbi:MAG: hypothetical protein D6780_02230 [Candidatus Dadabacteria bacterium]|nr:MAG: hypothetical protein D6780_02230 [Candidatus Dadabacteria bacterium]